jgi:light-regulated signal transduction histidine kinase (bacteriophytochrome)
MIASYLQLIERRYKGKLDKDADEFITFAVDGANRLQEMIIGLLAYSRVQTKGKPLEEVNSAEVLGYAVANLKLVIEESGALVTADTLPVIRADAGQLLQVFQNLIANAIKFRGKSAPLIHVSAEQTRAEWVFSIKDNGVGIEPEYKEKVFDMFRRLHGREYSGVGIGLSLCRRIIERHKGRIWLESEAGQGTTFNFTVPIKEDETI